MIHVLSSREEVLSKYGPNIKDSRTGPIHKHDGLLYVQIYMGQHEWLALQVEDPTVVFLDPGWEGTEFGWGVVDESSFPEDWPNEEIGPPEREGKPITVDGLLFAKTDKLKAYLGENDPLCAKWCGSDS